MAFKIETQEQETAFRRGYIEGWMMAQIASLSHPYVEMRRHCTEKLWPWAHEENKEVDVAPPSMEEE